jgi:tRNA-splicing endonuclease subunit sen54 N-term
MNEHQHRHHHHRHRRPVECIYCPTTQHFRVLQSRGKTLHNGGYGYIIRTTAKMESCGSNRNDGTFTTVPPTTPPKPTPTTTTTATTPATTTHHYLFLEEVLYLHERGLLHAYRRDYNPHYWNNNDDNNIDNGCYNEDDNVDNIDDSCNNDNHNNDNHNNDNHNNDNHTNDDNMNDDNHNMNDDNMNDSHTNSGTVPTTATTTIGQLPPLGTTNHHHHHHRPLLLLLRAVVTYRSPHISCINIYVPKRIVSYDIHRHGSVS